MESRADDEQPYGQALNLNFILGIASGDWKSKNGRMEMFEMGLVSVFLVVASCEMMRSLNICTNTSVLCTGIAMTAKIYGDSVLCH